MYVAKNINDFTINSDNHSINTRYKANLYPPLLSLTKYQKGVYYTGIKIYNCLPSKFRGLINNKIQFKKELKKIPIARLLLHCRRIP